MAQPPSTRELVEFGLQQIPGDRRIDVPLRDLMWIHQLLGELVRFFHQPMHYRDLAAVQSFLAGAASDSDGAYAAMADAYYRKVGDMLPADLRARLEAGDFEHPVPPAYYGDDV